LAFQQDPHGEMKKAGLSDDERAAVLSGDPNKIRSLMPGGAKFPPPNLTITVLIVIKF